MKSRISSFALLCLLLPTLASAAEYLVGGTSILRIEERNVPGDKETLRPVTQFLSIDSDKTGHKDLSFHFYGWGRADLADSSTSGGKTAGDFTYGYLLYRAPTANAEVKVGRFFFFEGGVSEQLDGVAARADVLPSHQGLALSAFAGRPVHLANGNTGEYLYGGRLSYRVASLLEIGATLSHEGGMVLNGTDANPKDFREIIGGDLWLQPHKMFELNGRTLYNRATGGIAEHNYRLGFKPRKDLSFEAAYQQNRLKDFYAATNLRSLFDPDSSDTLAVYSTSVTYALAAPLEMIADFRQINRDSRKGSNRFGAEARLTQQEGKLRSGMALHRVDAGSVKTGTESFIVTSYSELRGYGYYANGNYEASVDAIAHRYDAKIFGKKLGYELQASASYKLQPALKISTDLSYGDNPQIDQEIKALVRLVFAYIPANNNKGAGQ